MSTATGTVFKIAIVSENFQLKFIYSLHKGAITSISLNDTHFISGSEDHFIRVWPLDFTEFVLEAQHQSAISRVQFHGKEQSKVTVVTASGTIGLFNISARKFQVNYDLYQLTWQDTCTKSFGRRVRFST